MPRFFTHYWKNSTCNHYRYVLRSGGEPLNGVAGNLFSVKQIKEGDVIFVVSVFSGMLFLVGALTVEYICGKDEAANAWDCSPDEMWDAKDYAVAKCSTEKNYDCLIPLEITKSLRFIAADRTLRPLDFVTEDQLHQQTLRGVRELTPESAHLLTNILSPQVRPTRKRPTNSLPEEITTSEQFVEGAVTQIRINRYERSPVARQKCIAHFGVVCQVCHFDFETIYGAIGHHFIHIHHIVPLGAIKDEYQCDPITDLVPVCANCHAMLHRTMPPLAVEDLREIIFLRANGEGEWYYEGMNEHNENRA